MDFFRPLSPVSARRIVALAVVLLPFLTGCARHTQEVSDSKQVRVTTTVGTGRGRYLVHFEATRLQDHAPLAAVSVPVNAGGKSTVDVPRADPTEQRPTFTSFTAALTPTHTGQFQLVTKVALREAYRTKKSKLKFSKRNEGALLPIRVGDTQLASPPSDPVQINVRLERR